MRSIKLSLITSGILGFSLMPVLASAEVATLQVDTEKSSIEWLGQKVTGKHDGMVQIKEGTVQLDDGKIVGGEFVIDMKSIENYDLKDSPESKAKLENHLKSADFFEVESFPKSVFKITKVEHAASEGEVTLLGDLTVKGVTLPVSIPASIEKEGEEYRGKGSVTIDRSKWNVQYNSAKFFDPKKLGDKLIYDDIGITVNIVARPS